MTSVFWHEFLWVSPVSSLIVFNLWVSDFAVFGEFSAVVFRVLSWLPPSLLLGLISMDGRWFVMASHVPKAFFALLQSIFSLLLRFVHFCCSVLKFTGPLPLSLPPEL